jgi:hypothetical protein
LTGDASECIRPGMLTPQDARRLNGEYVTHYNVRLHSTIGFVAPHEMLACRQL